MNEVLHDSKTLSKSDLFKQSILEEASKQLQSLDLPSTRNEAWKYTRVAKLKSLLPSNPEAKVNFGSQKTQLDQIDSFVIPNLEGSVLVFVNGFYQEQLSTIEAESGISIAAMSEFRPTEWSKTYLGSSLKLENELFHCLNTSYATDGVVIKIEKNAQIKQSVQVLFISNGDQLFSGNRNLIVCDDFASAHITMSFHSREAKSCFTNTVSEIFVGDHAHLQIDKIQNESSAVSSIATEEVHQAANSVFTINTITLNGALVRNNLNISVDGQNAETNLSGAYVLKGKQLVDNHTVVDHRVAHCLSNELYKGVIDDEATAVFNGKVFVRKDAQKINAFQSNANVLLSDSASANSKPELEIYADDVKCSHGSTTGQLDEEAVFYLRARGLSEKSARALLVNAFIGDVLSKIEHEAVRSYIDQLLLENFGWS